MRNAIFIGVVENAQEAEVAVEFFKVGLRADANRAIWIARGGSRDTFSHEFSSEALSARVVPRRHAPDRGLLKLELWRHKA